MVIVLICNAMKLGCFLKILTMQHSPLITIGDAIESFLSEPDHTTKNQAPLTIMDAHTSKWKAISRDNGSIESSGWMERSEWLEKVATRHFFFRSASTPRWFITLLCCVVLLGTGIYLLANNIGYTTGFRWTIGQSAASTSGYLAWFRGGRLTGSLLTNLPQFLISSVYVSILTA